MISLIMLKKIESDIIKLMNKWRNDGQVVGLNNPEGDAEKIFFCFWNNMLALAEISHGDYNFHRWTSKSAEKYSVK